MKDDTRKLTEDEKLFYSQVDALNWLYTLTFHSKHSFKKERGEPSAGVPLCKFSQGDYETVYDPKLPAASITSKTKKLITRLCRVLWQAVLFVTGGDER